MSKLSNFSDRSSAERTVVNWPQKDQGTRPAFNKDTCPSKYNPHFWYLALVFRELALECELDYHRFGCYDEVQALVTANGWQSAGGPTMEIIGKMFQSLRFRFASRRGKPAVEIPDQEMTGPNWRCFVEMMIIAYWADIDEYTQFGDKDPLNEFRKNALVLLNYVNNWEIVDPATLPVVPSAINRRRKRS